MQACALELDVALRWVRCDGALRTVVSSVMEIRPLLQITALRPQRKREKAKKPKRNKQPRNIPHITP